jgi:Rps23 Pro-64 3,4-dihydroxylase Tpa1-like proline 4-hydroxylase
MPPYLVFRDFLPADKAAALLDWAIENETRFKPTTVGHASGERIDPEIRVSSSVGKFGDVREVLNHRLLEMAPALIRDLRVNALEITGTELELVAHNDGAFYGRHIDTATGASATGESLRFISATYYVHRQPKTFSGGALRLYSFDGDDHLDIQPEHNLLVVFPSWAQHQVTPISCPSRKFADSRFAVNIWIESGRRDRRAQFGAPAFREPPPH